MDLLHAKSPLAMLPALAFFLSPTSSTTRAPESRSSSSATTFFSRLGDGPPPPPASAMMPRRSSGQHQHLELERRMQHRPPPPPPPAPAAALNLSTNCTACGEPVAVEVPRWILAAMEVTQQQQQQQRVHGASYSDERSSGAPVQQVSSAAEWRDWVVSGAVRTAHAVRASPVSARVPICARPAADPRATHSQIPGLVLACLQTLFAILLYLDERFSIHQRLAIILGAFLEGLVEIEREVGILKGAGEALSIGWCVARSLCFFGCTADNLRHLPLYLKGGNRQGHHRLVARRIRLIARHGTDVRSSDAAFAKAGAADASVHTTGDAHRTRNSSHTPRASSPVRTAPYSDSFSSSESPSYLPVYETPESDYRYYDSVSTTRIPSPVLAPTTTTTTTTRPLRNFVSSPSLQSAYLSSLSPGPSPTLVGTPHEGMMPMSPSEALLSPFEPSSTHVRPRMVRQRSATGPDQVVPGGGIHNEGMSVPVPPPSPSDGVTRGGWAGKAVLGLAGRMKVL